jgi:hypothetical protein
MRGNGRISDQRPLWELDSLSTYRMHKTVWNHSISYPGHDCHPIGLLLPEYTLLISVLSRSKDIYRALSSRPTEPYVRKLMEWREKCNHRVIIRAGQEYFITEVLDVLYNGTRPT